MANLQKIIKVTQAQYDTLASGGTIGDYTGLNDNYVYLIQDTNTYITSNGGTIDGGDLTINGHRLNVTNGYGLHVYDDNHYTVAAVCADLYGDEIIYHTNDFYMPLFANDSDWLIYSDDDNYLNNFTFTTGSLTVRDNDDTKNYINISPRDGCIYYYNLNDDIEYNYNLPLTSGTLALTSDLPQVKRFI